jgi:hypothetical protein
MRCIKILLLLFKNMLKLIFTPHHYMCHIDVFDPPFLHTYITYKKKILLSNIYNFHITQI